MRNGRTLRIALDCRIPDPQQGIGTAVLALAHSLSDSPISGQEYTFIVRDELKSWLEPHIFGPCRLIGISQPERSKIREAVRAIPPLRAMWTRLHETRVAAVPVSDGYVESENFDLVHFPTPIGYVTSLPSIYQPWDLQHLHYPEFFSKTNIASRERLYRALCDQARYVCVQTEWSKSDVAEKYKIDPEKIAVIPWGSVLDAHEPPSEAAIRAAKAKFALPGQFFFYPAVTWPHKNHAVIFRALERMKSEDGREVHVYFTGKLTEHREKLDALARELGVAEQVHYLGFVTPEELQAIFATATAMIFASKFEGFGLPIFEAFHARLPVVCADATVLPEVAGDAALYFDPDSPEELADRMRSMRDNPQARQDLISKGSMILSRHSMRDTVLAFHDLYERTVAGLQPSLSNV